MIMQLSRHLLDCPICGRPVQVQSRYVGHEIGCRHCRGQFIVYHSDGGLTAARRDETDLFERAEQLLQREDRATGHPSLDRSTRLFPLPSDLEREKQPNQTVGALRKLDTSWQRDLHAATAQPTMVLVEHRDEVFARIAADVAKTGVRVVRATTATGALQSCGRGESMLVIANLDLLDQSGWLLAAKVRLFDQRIQIWLYQPNSSPRDTMTAWHLKVDELIDYHGDLLALSDMISARLGREGQAGESYCRNPRAKQYATS